MDYDQRLEYIKREVRRVDEAMLRSLEVSATSDLVFRVRNSQVAITKKQNAKTL